MNDITLIDEILALPQKFYAGKSESFYGLLKASGYFKYYNDVTEVNIYEQLKKHPEYCNQWIEWSENQRSDAGWYIQQKDKNTYIVGYFPPQRQIIPKQFNDSIQALAYFIKNQIEVIRKYESQ